MFFESNFNAVLLISLLIVIVFVVIYKFIAPKPKDDLEKALLDLKLVLITVGFLTAILWIMLPFTNSMLNPPIISDSAGSAEVNQKLFSYAQNIALAVDRIKWVLHFYFLIFVTGFFGAVYQVIKASGYLKKEEESANDVLQDG